jgi:hypothetical protein
MALWRRLPGCGDAVVLRHMRRDVEGALIGHMIGGVTLSPGGLAEAILVVQVR